MTKNHTGAQRNNLFLLAILMLTSLLFANCQKIDHNNDDYDITKTEVTEILNVAQKSFKNKTLEIIQNELLKSKPVIHLVTLGDTSVKYIVPLQDLKHQVKGYISFQVDSAYNLLRYKVYDKSTLQNIPINELGETSYVLETMQKNGYTVHTGIKRIIDDKMLDNEKVDEFENLKIANRNKYLSKRSSTKSANNGNRCTAEIEVQFAGVGSVCNPSDFNILAEALTQKIREYFSNKAGQAYFENGQLRVIAPDLWEFNFQTTAQEKIITLMQYNIPFVPCIGYNTNPRVTYFSKWCTGDDPENPFPEEGGGSGENGSNTYFSETEFNTILDNLENGLNGDPIEFYLIASYKNSKLLNSSTYSIGANSIQVGDYTLTPHYDSKGVLKFYTASRNTNLGIEYIVRADALNKFQNDYKLYSAAANAFYINGIPSQAQIQMASGNFFEGLSNSWASAIKDPSYYFYLTHVLYGIGVNTFELKPLGLGSTGRATATNLEELLAMKEIISNPRLGDIAMVGMSDPRWYGWNKMQYIHRAMDGTKITIHYVGKFENGVLKAVDDFKFIN
ncbi:hypothetical protein [Sphingobacterium thalpophilum]|uniref:hypothetical protein n=1 Tax=Sphingobacterium thalpophilum TaxID=259 RepID=UPI003C719D07